MSIAHGISANAARFAQLLGERVAADAAGAARLSRAELTEAFREAVAKLPSPDLVDELVRDVKHLEAFISVASLDGDGDVDAKNADATFWTADGLAKAIETSRGDPASAKATVALYTKMLRSYPRVRGSEAIPGLLAAAHTQNGSWDAAACESLSKVLGCALMLPAEDPSPKALVLLRFYLDWMRSDDKCPIRGVALVEKWGRVLRLVQHVCHGQSNLAVVDDASFNDHLAAGFAVYSSLVTANTELSAASRAGEALGAFGMQLLGNSPQHLLDGLLQFTADSESSLTGGGATVAWTTLSHVVRAVLRMLSGAVPTGLYLRAVFAIAAALRCAGRAGVAASAEAAALKSSVGMIQCEGGPRAAAKKLRMLPVDLDQRKAVERLCGTWDSIGAAGLLGCDEGFCVALYDALVEEVAVPAVAASAPEIGKEAENETESGPLFFADVIGDSSEPSITATKEPSPAAPVQETQEPQKRSSRAATTNSPAKKPKTRKSKTVRKGVGAKEKE